MQVKTTMMLHLTAVRMAIIGKSKATNASDDAGGVSTTSVTATMMAGVMRLLRYLKIDLPYNTASPLLENLSKPNEISI